MYCSFLQRRPVDVARAPVGVGRQPHGERLGEVLVWMALRVPAVEVQDVAFAVRLGRVVVRILHVGRAEDTLAAQPVPQPVGVVDGVPGFVAEDLQAPLRRAALDLEHLGPLELLQPRVGQVEGNRHARHAVGREPFGGKPEVRVEPRQPAGGQLAAKLGDDGLERAALDADVQIADPQIHQLVVGPGGPFRLCHSGGSAPQSTGCRALPATRPGVWPTRPAVIYPSG